MRMTNVSRSSPADPGASRGVVRGGGQPCRSGGRGVAVALCVLSFRAGRFRRGAPHRAGGERRADRERVPEIPAAEVFAQDRHKGDAGGAGGRDPGRRQARPGRRGEGGEDGAPGRQDGLSGPRGGRRRGPAGTREALRRLAALEGGAAHDRVLPRQRQAGLSRGGRRQGEEGQAQIHRRPRARREARLPPLRALPRDRAEEPDGRARLDALLRGAQDAERLGAQVPRLLPPQPAPVVLPRSPARPIRSTRPARRPSCRWRSRSRTSTPSSPTSPPSSRRSSPGRSSGSRGSGRVSAAGGLPAIAGHTVVMSVSDNISHSGETGCRTCT